MLRLGENTKLLLLKHRNTGCGYLTLLGIAPFLGGSGEGVGKQKINSERKLLMRICYISVERIYISTSKYIKL